MFVADLQEIKALLVSGATAKNGVQHEGGAFDDGNLHSFQSTGAYERAFSLS